MNEIELMSEIYSIIDACPKDDTVPHPFRDILNDIMAEDNPHTVTVLTKLKELNIETRDQLFIALADVLLMSVEMFYTSGSGTDQKN